MITKKNRVLIVKAVAFVVVLFVADRVAGALLKNLFNRNEMPEYQRISYVINTADEEMFIFGSSRAVHHYVPFIFSDSLDMSCYNAGKDGHFIWYNYALLRCVRQRMNPKLIVLDLTPLEFQRDKDSDLAPLLPYYQTHPEIQGLIRNRNPFEAYKLLSASYPYNSLVLSIFVWSFLPDTYTDRLHGYIPIGRVLAGNRKHIWPGKIDSAAVNIFRNFIDEAKRGGTKLSVFVSPWYNSFDTIPPTLTIAEKICRQNNVPFHNLIQDTTFINHKRFFSDGDHLNHTGATIYSEKVMKIIRNDLRISLSF